MVTEGEEKMGKHLMVEEKVEIIIYREQSKTIRETARVFGISHSTAYDICCNRDEILAKYYVFSRREGASQATAGIKIIPEEIMSRKVSAEDL